LNWLGPRGVWVRRGRGNGEGVCNCGEAVAGIGFRLKQLYKMSATKVAISIDQEILRRLDRLVKDRSFRNRSEAVEVAISEKIARLDKEALARECAKLDPRDERALAEEGLATDLASWPKY
jgi:Arc/MetJ-type ribon-helix-helix transcriptional regulator